MSDFGSVVMRNSQKIVVMKKLLITILFFPSGSLFYM